MSFPARLLTVASVFWSTVCVVVLAFAAAHEPAGSRPLYAAPTAQRPAVDTAVVSTPQAEATARQASRVAALLRLPEVGPMREDPLAYYWKADPGDPPRTAACPVGWVCTLVTAGVEGTLVVVGDDTWYRIREGTFRRVADYPAGSLVEEQSPCWLVEQEAIRLGHQIRPGNFDCSALAG